MSGFLGICGYDTPLEESLVVSPKLRLRKEPTGLVELV